MNSLSEMTSIVDELLAARLEAGHLVDIGAAGLSRFEALAVQLDVADRFAGRNDPVAGWKVAYTSGAQRDRMGPGFRAFGFVPASRVLPSGARVPLTALRRPAIEVEICLRVDGEGAVTGVAPAFELIDKRISADADDATVIADGCSNWGIVVGRFVPVPEGPLTAREARLSSDGQEVARDRPGDTMDDPLLSVARLVERLGEFGRRVADGQCVITGSVLKSAVTGPGTWTGEIDGLGAVDVSLV